MKYPAIKTAAAEQIARDRLANQHVDTSDLIAWKQTPDTVEDPIDLHALKALGTELSNEISQTEPTPVNRDAVEGAYSSRLFRVLVPVPIEILDDPGFWAYISIECFFDFIAWRENLSGADANKYYDGRNSTEGVLLRMYQRGRLVSPNDDLATAIPRATDFWRSHIIRVQTSTSPELSQAMAESQAANRMKTGELRELAKRVNRLWTNVSMHSYSLDEARAIVLEQRQQLTQSTE